MGNSIMPDMLQHVAEMFRQQPDARNMGFLTSLFKVGPDSFTDVDKISMDMVCGGNDMAPVIRDLGTGAVVVTIDRFENMEVPFPVYSLETPVNIRELMSRMPGENAFLTTRGENWMGRIAKLIKDGTSRHIRMIKNAMEGQAAQVLTTGKCTLTDEGGNRPLAKSVCQLEIADPRDQAEAPPAVAVPLRKYAKPIHEPYRMLVARAGAGKLAVPALVLRAQRALLRLLLRQIAVAAQLSHALAPAVQQQLGAGQKARERPLEKAEIVRHSRGEGKADYQPVGFPRHDLRFHGAPLLLARIAPALFFFGRSIGVSVASTRITSQSMPSFSRAFFPGS